MDRLREMMFRLLERLLFWRRFTPRRLANVIEAHQLWFSSRQKQGVQAILSGANLKGSRLAETNLRGADLSGANLSASVLNMADLREADLSGTNLQQAELRDCDLR
ncbi:MAG TPA: pentapeptide repeat-containing protein, partial [Desulfobacterales bacterium]|nr:pentapeptide repeat-containing protein [Desulfobacterales bacterium]